MTSHRKPEDDPPRGLPQEPERLREYARWEESAAGDIPGLDFEKLHAELQGKLAAERGPRAWLRSRPTPVRALLAGLALSLLVMATMALWLRPDFEVYPQGRMLAVLISIAGLIVVELVLVLWPLQLPAAPRWLMIAAVVGAPIGLLFWYGAPPAHTDHPRSIAPTAPLVMLAGAMRCVIVGSAVAGAIYALVRSLDRGGADRTLLMAACAGLAGNLMLQLHCPVTAPAHLVIGHLGVVVLCFGFAAWLEREKRA